MFPNSAAARDSLVEALELDLVGPTNDHPFARELLPRSPRHWYLTGMLVPVDAKLEAKEDPGAHEDLDAPSESDNADDGGTPDKAPARRGFFPSSIGLSFLLQPGVSSLKIRLEWGEYEKEEDGHASDTDDDEEPEESASLTASGAASARRGFRRTPCTHELEVSLHPTEAQLAGVAHEVAVPNALGMFVAVVCRTVDTRRMPSLRKGTTSVSLFLVNRKPAAERPGQGDAVFQPRIVIPDATALVPRADLRGEEPSNDWDDRVADLQYRDAREYAVGHGVAVRTRMNGSQVSVESAWIPRATVERVEPAPIGGGVVLSMEQLAALPDVAAARTALGGIPERYSQWIAEQAKTGGLSKSQQETLSDLGDAQRAVCKRIAAGIELLGDPAVLDAFCTANRAMATQARRRMGQIEGRKPSEVNEPTWRPFQLAFLLMAMQGIVEPKHQDRETVDLLFFPTGGGKTEAYLGLAAFTLVLRRLRHPGSASAGVTVLMRYTLRLLTLDQLSRATTLICALELERQQRPEKLGAHAFEIGLWVGRAATPNEMGERRKGAQPSPESALVRTLEFKRGRSSNPPIPLEACPWCGAQFTKESFDLRPDLNQPTDLHVVCSNRHCDFTGTRALPIVAVDEPLYRRLPCFVIATVDKFASLPWKAEVGSLLGQVHRSGAQPLLPPELIIQDELHLISGPLGTVAGIYEAAIDYLASRDIDGVRVRPKIVASTATVRRADSQIRALFDRRSVAIFPPAGPDRRDSFFALTKRDEDIRGRLYVGIAAPGRSMKVVYLRSMIALLAAGQRGYAEARSDASNPMDPYMTVLAYFNSLRELGGSRRIAEDEITYKLQNPPRRRLEPTEELFSSRNIQNEPLELTSRIDTDKVAEAKHLLGQMFCDKGHVDLALATNMISVGLDITRLGLMVVLGQPKSSSEYIQATSRVGRDRAKPGLVVTLLNIHKPRDRSHYERFESYHQTFYRSVEATSVTPTAPRALDRALAPALVGLIRHARKEFQPNGGPEQMRLLRAELDVFAQYLARRARSAAPPGESDATHDTVLTAVRIILDKWQRLTLKVHQDGSKFVYDSRKLGGVPLLREVLDPKLSMLSADERTFRAPRSMRDVEPSVDLIITSPRS